MYLIIQWIRDTEIMNAKATHSDGERNGLSVIKVVMKNGSLAQIRTAVAGSRVPHD